MDFKINVYSPKSCWKEETAGSPAPTDTGAGDRKEGAGGSPAEAGDRKEVVGSPIVGGRRASFDSLRNKTSVAAHTYAISMLTLYPPFKDAGLPSIFVRMLKRRFPTEAHQDDIEYTSSYRLIRGTVLPATVDSCKTAVQKCFENQATGKFLVRFRVTKGCDSLNDQFAALLIRPGLIDYSQDRRVWLTLPHLDKDKVREEIAICVNKAQTGKVEEMIRKAIPLNARTGDITITPIQAAIKTEEPADAFLEVPPVRRRTR